MGWLFVIGYFPSPFLDEMIYSIVSRYHLISSNMSENQTSQDLFSRNMSNIKMDLFPFARELEERLKHFGFYSASEIINSFSFYNYYTKFLVHHDVEKFKSLMLDERPGRIKNEIYCHDIEKFNCKYYKFCSKCIEEDSIYGVPYWHITHNLPGITICNKHKCKLIASKVLFNGKKLVSLINVVQGTPLPRLNDKEEELLKLINEETIYLFSTEQDFSEYITPYISFLYSLGYIDDFFINEKDLIDDFVAFYSDDICEILGIDKKFIINKIIESIKYASSNIHPLFHILFIIFCDKKIENINNNALITPFGPTPSKCIVCKSIDRYCIHKSILRYREQGIKGTFWCSCGYNYYINSWEKNNIVTISYGEALCKYITELLFEEDLSISGICNRLHITKQELKCYLNSGREKY